MYQNMKPFYVRTIIGALLILFVITGSSSLWFYYRIGKLDAEIKELKRHQERRIPEDPNAKTVPADAPDAPEDSLSTEDFSKSGDETVSRFVSPFGFGPYPALPDGWPPETWPCLSSEHELTARVEIKLISQGRQVYGAIMEDGLVYPTFKNTVYIRWETEGNHTYISDLAGDPAACERLTAIMDERRMDFTTADIPPDIKQVPFDEGGIDPYEFLEIPRR